jgi:CP family cyanate transporter-like MFS transporter
LSSRVLISQESATHTTPANRLWGRFLAFAAIILVAASIRPAVSAVAPVIPLITVDIPLTAVAIGVLGLLGPACYSLFGTISPWLANRVTLEWTLAGAVGLVGLGQVMRAFYVDTDTAFIFWSFVAIGGIGIANVLLPPIVRRFFPDRFGLMTGLYSMTIAITTFLPSIVTPIVAQYTGWREAIGMWFIFAVLALLPLVSLIFMSGTSRNSINRELRKSVAGKIWTSPTSWAIAGAFALSSFFAYTDMSWLPLVLADRIGANAIEAGAITATAAATGLPMNLLVPLIASRMKNPALLYLVSGACGLSGALGMLFIPAAAPYLWAILLGLASLIFSLNLYLLNLRTKSQEGTVVLSGMAQGIGYAVSAIGPLLFGILHQITGGWDAPLLMLVVGAFGAVPIFFVLRKPILVDE